MFLHSTFCIISIHLHPPLTVKSILLFFLVIVSLLIQFHVSKFPIPYLCKIHVFSIRSPFELQIFLTGKRFYTFSLRNVLIKIKILNLSLQGKELANNTGCAWYLRYFIYCVLCIFVLQINFLYGVFCVFSFTFFDIRYMEMDFFNICECAWALSKIMYTQEFLKRLIYYVGQVFCHLLKMLSYLTHKFVFPFS